MAAIDYEAWARQHGEVMRSHGVQISGLGGGFFTRADTGALVAPQEVFDVAAKANLASKGVVYGRPTEETIQRDMEIIRGIPEQQKDARRAGTIIGIGSLFMPPIFQLGLKLGPQIVGGKFNPTDVLKLGANMFSGFDISTGSGWSDVLLGGANMLLQYKAQEDAQKQALRIAQASAPQVQQAAFPAMPAGFPAIFGSALGTVARVGGAAVGVIRSVSGRIVSIMLPSGQKVTRKAAINLAKQMGVTGAATALGIGAVELAEMIVQDQGKSRRGKGISAAQLRTTRRTMTTVEKMHRQIAGYCRDAGVRTTRFVRAPAPSFGKRCK